jgi:hypothetical protein
MFPSTLTLIGSKAGFTFHISGWTFKYGDSRATFTNANTVLAEFLLWQMRIPVHHHLVNDTTKYMEEL